MDFKPVFRMMVCSDIHFGVSTKSPENFDYVGQEIDWFEKSVAFAYAYADACEYNKLDAFAAVGDFVDCGKEEEMQSFKQSLDKVIRKDTDITLTMASHEYFFDGVDNANERFVRIFGQQPVKHTKINGFHLIGVSTDDRCQTGIEKQNWLAENLKIAHADDPKKPIFMFFHPQFQNTVYGSAVLWRTANMTRITMNYPQVIDFGGHSHASVNDPRTVHQNHFTCFGTGSIVGISVCNADRLSSRAFGSSQFLIVEADADGRVRVIPMDGTNGMSFGDGWIVERPYDPDSFTYTDERYQMANNPAFPENAVLDCKYADGKLAVTIPQATDDGERVPGYYFTVKNEDGIVVRKFGVSSSYYKYQMPEFENYQVDFEMESGTYFVECYAQSFFDKKSKKISATFKV